MPAVSKAQFRAMQAAAHGVSNLGIPSSVGKEFVAATPNVKRLPQKKVTKQKRKSKQVYRGNKYS